MTWWIVSVALAGKGLEPVTPVVPVEVDPTAIVGGEPTAPGEAPAVGALFVASLYGCTGVLIAPDLVLSAGHCWSATSLEKSVVLGTSDHDGDEGERLLIVEDWQMPNYLETFDIGLFALERPATTPPVRLLRSCDAPGVLEDGVEATILGYGATDLEGREPTTQLHRAVVTIDDADCDDLERGCRSAVSPGGELRAGGDGVDTCIGDSGGPLFVEGPEGPVLAGITSRSALPAPTDCGNGGLYVRVDAVIDWIEETSGRRLAGEPCEPEPAPDKVATGDTGLDNGVDRCGCASAAGVPWELGLAAWLTVVARGRGRRERRAVRRLPRG